jgi:hypothetical protein
LQQVVQVIRPSKFVDDQASNSWGVLFYKQAKRNSIPTTGTFNQKGILVIHRLLGSDMCLGE